MIMRVGVIGCGLIGRKRAASLGKRAKLVACADINYAQAEKLAKDYGGKAYESWKAMLEKEAIDVAIVATPHNLLLEVARGVMNKNIHLLLEKPAGRNVYELNELVSLEKISESLVHVGFNHRFHRGLIKAHQIVKSGDIGQIMFIRGRYGHGGRVGYDKEWRSKPELSGGGELIDQGSHLIDLSRWFLGDFNLVEGFATTYFWDMPVDDNGFMILRNEIGQASFLQVSCTEWKNLFSFEIYGKNGKIDISGLGGSYGVEKITYYKMLPEMGPPETITWEYPMADNSWSVEIESFFDLILGVGDSESPTLTDALECHKIIATIYERSGYDYCS